MTTNSYDSRKDVLAFSDAGDRPLNPAREMYAVTKDDTNDLPIYGKLVVFNAHATNAEVIRVVPVASQDDSAYVDIKVPVGLTVINWLIVRAVRSTGTGADITAWVIA
jgi:hypothetical protein